jgi:hypothetical protein
MPEMPTITDDAEMEKAGTPPERHCRIRALGYNLPDVFTAAWTGGGATTSTGHRRVVRTVDPTARDVSRVRPLPVIGFADGVQSQFTLRHVAHRPVSIVWAAAGAVDNAATLLEFRQRLELVASAADGNFLAGLSRAAGGLPFHLVEDLTPWGVAVATQRLVDEWRREVESDVVATVPISEARFLMVDGSIRRHSRDGVVGVIKSVDTQYLADESALPDRAGWRSAVFSLPATTTAERDVVSAYLRLHDAPGSTSWSHGLIRLEAHDPETLDRACALALRHRQSAGSGDPRWATHLEGMHMAEEVLKAFRHPFLEW